MRTILFNTPMRIDFIFKWYGTCTRHTITRP